LQRRRAHHAESPARRRHPRVSRPCPRLRLRADRHAYSSGPRSSSASTISASPARDSGIMDALIQPARRDKCTRHGQAGRRASTRCINRISVPAATSLTAIRSSTRSAASRRVHVRGHRPDVRERAPRLLRQDPDVIMVGGYPHFTGAAEEIAIHASPALTSALHHHPHQRRRRR
jgi:hypothetical protein